MFLVNRQGHTELCINFAPTTRKTNKFTHYLFHSKLMQVPKCSHDTVTTSMICMNQMPPPPVQDPTPHPAPPPSPYLQPDHFVFNHDTAFGPQSQVAKLTTPTSYFLYNFFKRKSIFHRLTQSLVTHNTIRCIRVDVCVWGLGRVGDPSDSCMLCL